jgi:hypothetical protein
MGGHDESEALAVVNRLGRLIRRWRKLTRAWTGRPDPTGEIEAELPGLVSWEEHVVKRQVSMVGEQLSRQGGSDFMLHIWYGVGDRYGLAIATRLWHGWEGIKGWPP